VHTLPGTMWKLIEASAFDEQGHELPPPLGQEPMGFTMFEAERVIVAASDGRSSLPSDVRSRAFVAYTGRYHFDGSEIVTTVDGASNLDVPKQQIRHQILFGTSGSIRQTLRRGLASRPTFGDLGCSLKLWWLRPCHESELVRHKDGRSGRAR